MTHIPVMTAEVARSICAPSSGGLFVDCTVGLGGHSRALLEAGASRIIGLDRDLDALARARETLAPWGDRVELVHADYRAIDDVLDSRQIAARRRRARRSRRLVDAVRRAGPRLQLSARRAARHAHGSQPAARRRPIWSRESSERDLADAIFQYGEERFSRRIARALVEARARGAGRHAPAGWRRSSAAPSRIAAATCASIRRPARSRRCASGSTASSTASIASSRPPPAGCAPARGWW